MRSSWSVHTGILVAVSLSLYNAWARSSASELALTYDGFQRGRIQLRLSRPLEKSACLMVEVLGELASEAQKFSEVSWVSRGVLSPQCKEVARDETRIQFAWDQKTYYWAPSDSLEKTRRKREPYRLKFFLFNNAKEAQQILPGLRMVDPSVKPLVELISPIIEGF